jgi:hypothetical protein
LLKLKNISLLIWWTNIFLYFCHVFINKQILCTAEVNYLIQNLKSYDDAKFAVTATKRKPYQERVDFRSRIEWKNEIRLFTQYHLSADGDVLQGFERRCGICERK